MRTPSLPILVGLLVGFCLGGSVRYFASDHEPTTADSTLGRQGEITSEVPQSHEEQPHLPRPTLEEVLEIGGIGEAALLARYLEEATIDEVLALMEAISRGDTQINDLRWMVELRGVELDPPAMVAWAKKAEGTFSCRFSEFRLRKMGRDRSAGCLRGESSGTSVGSASGDFRLANR